MNSIIRKSLPAALTATIVAGAFTIPAIATTDDDAGSSDTTAEATEESDDAGGRRGPRGFGPRGLEDGELAERLAAELGIDADEVRAAMETVKADLAQERLAEAVEDGRLTQEQADRILQAIADGNVDEVRQAIRLEQLEARLDEKVEAGELTQQEADEILAAAEAGDLPHRGQGHRRGPRGFDGPGRDAAADGEADTTSA